MALKMGRVMTLPSETIEYRFTRGVNPEFANANLRFKSHEKRPLKEVYLKMGRVMGLEPTNTGTTTRGLNHLATPAI